jgi:hypothetical protein
MTKEAPMNTAPLKASLLPAVALLALALPAAAAERAGFEMTVLVGGRPAAEYRASGKVYVEAIRGKEYALRLTNPYPCRVAVALSVDGLNTIDARRTDAAGARKWVLDPYETVVISGWQVTGREARKFFFTGEKGSYGAILGQTDNLGVIEAVVFKEIRPRLVDPPRCPRSQEPDEENRSGAAGSSPAPQAESSRRQDRPESKAAPTLSDDYAATGIGDKVRHEVTQISMELEQRPCAVVSVRYEFRPQLISLGVLPRPAPCPMERRGRATGFEQAYCPDPYTQDP